MNPVSKFSTLIRMLEAFIHGENVHRGIAFVREIEGEFARSELDDEDEFSDLLHALAMYRGREEDIRDLKSEAIFTVRRLVAR
jgi:hypothetical protein